jgi:translation elongation factor EF-Tu-like GTPase
MQIRKFRAHVAFGGKTRPVMAGFRPTLIVGGRKVLSNIEEIQPASVQPHQTATAVFAIAWDWPEACPLQEGAKFDVFEGGKKVGYGSVLELM